MSHAAGGREQEVSYNAIVDRVHRRGGLSRAQAVHSILVILQTVAERIGTEAASRLAKQLPAALGNYLRGAATGEAEPFSFGEFCQRVAIRERSNVPDAIAHARCVIETLEETVETGESGDVLSQLHRNFAPLFY